MLYLQLLSILYCRYSYLYLVYIYVVISYQMYYLNYRAGNITRVGVTDAYGTNLLNGIELLNKYACL